MFSFAPIGINQAGRAVWCRDTTSYPISHHWRCVGSLRLAAKPPQNEPKPLDQNAFQRQTREMENKSQAEDKASKRRDRLAEALRENLKRRKQARRADNPKTEDKASK